MSAIEAPRRARAIVASGAVIAREPPAAPSEGDAEAPWDLAALYATTDGLELADRTRFLGREAAVKATAWLVAEKSLDWGADLLVLGERDDVIIVHDRDSAGARAGGGVLAAAGDQEGALAAFARSAEARAAAVPRGAEAAEIAAAWRAAAVAADKAGATVIAVACRAHSQR